MKKFIATIAIAGFLTACNDANTNQTQTDTAASTTIDSLNAVGFGTDTTGPAADTATTRPAGVVGDTTTTSAH